MEPLRRNVTSVRIVAVEGGSRSERPDALATEEPMEIRVAGPAQQARSVAVTMRTPGRRHGARGGLLVHGGLIGPGDVQRVAYCDDLAGEEQRYNVVTVTINRAFDFDRLHRNFFATSSCGICGKAALDDVEVRCAPVEPGPTVPASFSCRSPMRSAASRRSSNAPAGCMRPGCSHPRAS